MDDPGLRARLRDADPYEVVLSLAGGLVAIGASTVLLFGYPTSPLAQPRNIVLGNTVAAVVSVGCVAVLGTSPLAMGLAVGLAIALGQLLRCLHPPAGPRR